MHQKPVFPPRGESADGGMAGKAGDTDSLIAREVKSGLIKYVYKRQYLSGDALDFLFR